MATSTIGTSAAAIKCCPELQEKPVCDTLSFRYRLPFQAKAGKDTQRVPVEVVLHFELTRCTGPLTIGDPIYSTTLLPGEQVRLFTSDRHTHWSYDSESQLSYRHETTSEESYYTHAMAEAISDITASDEVQADSSFESSWAKGGGGASLNLGIVKIGGGGGGGSYDSKSTYDFSRNISQHAHAASSYAAAGVRAASSTAIGEVEQRTHAEGESEAHYESSSRSFRNPNRCHAVTYLFHKINKTQTVSFRLKAIERRVDDPKVPTGAYQKVVPDTTGRIMVKPQYITAANKDRLQIEHVAYTSAAEHQQAAKSGLGLSSNKSFAYAAATATPVTADLSEPTYSIVTRDAAIKAVDNELMEAGLIDRKTGLVSEKIIAELSWERTEILPTPGIIVKGCLDECDTCEASLKKEIELDLERRQLENELLKRKIELLDQAQEYRCCPVELIEDEDADNG
ncbi:hypothetical protein EKD00_07585 [Chlorobium phaeovibrioides]|uniref:hypothetical protein n=1 Tax=Chlorobium phaeovibrioides TaxID=1094 RepID=UPI000F823295|nr:hypothetical protein [Chlorobium phaeovibrioides]RTY34637.1 hypothetical protein EKD00_07585 [Chlorobium phaeovibrioides]